MTAAPASIRVAGTAVVLRDGEAGVETLLLRRPESGSFPGAWVFPGGRVDPGDAEGTATEMDAAQRAAIRETREEAGIRVHDLAAISCWMPPAETPVKFRTWFFLARERGDELQANAGEIDEALWLSPQGAFERHADGALTLFPPTWVTLHGLREHRSVDDVYAARGEVAQFATRLAQTSTGRLACWAGDEEYPDAPGPVSGRHRLLMGELPWRYERS
ncbi:Putative NUDIX/MutT-family hydrolase [Microbacterium esteraromaticum]|uniref:Putative NUDIX/MutT-family hydrolase n=1 Tax=Microbacterium esteraromaticum TaxID=57043 RepID=A0A1R4JH51_9MICO|nr:NUDIX hydrolase [Microbacterium esteraromaticum]SJN31264.1 Putative NUDIX/MutT-family hydrolase [Microbacterium esteraromaticum]